MKNLLAFLIAVGLLSAATQTTAQVTISEVFHVDPGWDVGGYWEFTVTNNTGGDIYFVAIGDTLANYVEVRYPDLTGIWHPTRIDVYDWDVNEYTFQPTAWTPPVLSDYPSAVYFPSAQQVLLYYVLGSNAPLANGASRDGLLFNNPLPAVTKWPRPTLEAGMSFLAFNGTGQVVAQGTVGGPPLATRQSTWGAVKALYR